VIGLEIGDVIDGPSPGMVSVGDSTDKGTGGVGINS